MGGFRKNIKYMLQQLLEFFVRKTGIADNAPQGVWVQSIMPRNDYFPGSVSHAGVLSAIIGNPKFRFFKSADCPFRRDIGKKHTKNSLCKSNFDFSNFRSLQFLRFHMEIGLYRVADVFERFFFSISLAMASRKRRHVDVVPVVAFVDNNKVFHNAIISIYASRVNRALTPAEIKRLYNMGR